MSWTPPHNNFTTFVKDANNIYIKCEDGSWVVLTLAARSPVGPFGGIGPELKRKSYTYLEQKWEIIGQRAIAGDLSSKIVGERGEVVVIGIKLNGDKVEEVRNVFTFSGIIADKDATTLVLLGTKSTYLHKDIYAFGKKAEKLCNTPIPIFGNKRSECTEEYELSGILSTQEVIETLLEGIKKEEITDLVVANGRVSEMLSIGASLTGSKVDTEKQTVAIVGKKDFSTLLNILLMEL